MTIKTRIITAAAALALFIPVLYFSETFIFPAALGLLSGISVYEFVSCCCGKDRALFFAPVMVIAAVMPFAARENAEYLFYLTVAVFLYLLVLSVLKYKSVKTTDIFAVFFGFAYAALAFSMLVLARDAENGDFLLVFIAAWCTDTFAYFTGNFLGKKKLCPELSPKKTVEGTIGGVFGSVFGFCVYGVFKIFMFDGAFDFMVYIIIAAAASLLAQAGDLAASAVKRAYGVKDYGNIFPGHGGVMDRFDSILPLSMAAFVLINLFG